MNLTGQHLLFLHAHLDRYADGLKEGMSVKRGDVIGYVGTTGNALRIRLTCTWRFSRLGPEKRWWEGTAIDAYPLLINLVKSRRAAPPVARPVTAENTAGPALATELTS